MRRALGYTLAVLVGVPALYTATDRTIYRFERNDDFCVSCHLTETTVLHEKLMADFRADAPAVLAAAHRSAETPVRCIDCHYGEGVVGRAQVLAVSGFDTLQWALGVAEEPSGLAWLPFPDAACARCHAEAAKGLLKDGEFHNRRAHVDTPVACIACHAAHDPGDPELSFLAPERVLAECRTCHANL